MVIQQDTRQKKQPITRFVRWLKRTKDKRHRKTRALFYKVLVLLIEVYAMALLGASYYLAYLDKSIVLEDLSKTLVKAIIYPFVAFTINRTIENYAEHNTDKFRQPIEYKEDEDE